MQRNLYRLNENSCYGENSEIRISEEEEKEEKPMMVKLIVGVISVYSSQLIHLFSASFSLSSKVTNQTAAHFHLSKAEFWHSLHPVQPSEELGL